MHLRGLWLSPLLALPLLGGCGAVSQVRTAFEIPVSPTPSPKELARARETRAVDSLSKSLSQLNSQTLGKYFSSGDKPGSQTTAPRGPQPARFDAAPAQALANTFNRGASVPVAPRQIAISLSRAQTIPAANFTTPPGEATRVLGPRTLRTSRYTSDLGRETLTEFLQGWVARDSLRRADDALLGQRALADRIALQTRATRPTLDLSLVPPETQLELTNLRLQLLPMLSGPESKRIAAKQRIEAIQKRLNDIWQQETDRQNALLQQSLVEIPARLRQEGEKVIAQNTRTSAEQSRTRQAQVRNDFENRLVSSTLPSLSIAQPSSVAPNIRGVSATVGAPNATPNAGKAPFLGTMPGDIGIARGGSNASISTARRVAARNERVWKAATR